MKVEWMQAEQRIIKQGDISSNLTFEDDSDLEKVQTYRPIVHIFETPEAAGEASGKLAAERSNFFAERDNLVRLMVAAAPSQDFHAAEYVKAYQTAIQTLIFHMDEYFPIALTIKDPIGAVHAAEDLFRARMEDPQIKQMCDGVPELIKQDAARAYRSVFDINFEPHNFKKYIIDHYLNALNQFLGGHFIADAHGDTIEQICLGYANLLKRFGRMHQGFYGIGEERAHVAFIEQEKATLKDIGSVISVDVKPQQQFNDFKNHEDPLMRYRSIDEVPKKAASLTLRELLYPGPEEIYVTVIGEQKAESTLKMLEGKRFYQGGVPASFFEVHPNVMIFLDKAAASRLENTNNYIYHN